MGGFRSPARCFGIAVLKRSSSVLLSLYSEAPNPWASASLFATTLCSRFDVYDAMTSIRMHTSQDLPARLFPSCLPLEGVLT